MSAPSTPQTLSELRIKIGSVAHVQETLRGMLIDEIMADISAISQPATRAIGAKFRRESFDDRAFFAAIERCMDAAGTNDKQLAKITGISSSTLSRMRNGTRVCDAASLAALSAWAGINPASYCNAACRTCNGHGMIGGFVGGGAPGYVSDPCPDCNNTEPLAALSPPALAAARAFGAGLDEQSLEQGEVL